VRGIPGGSDASVPRGPTIPQPFALATQAAAAAGHRQQHAAELREDAGDRVQDALAQRGARAAHVLPPRRPDLKLAAAHRGAAPARDGSSSLPVQAGKLSHRAMLQQLLDGDSTLA
jgi:hypothetical protein